MRAVIATVTEATVHVDGKIVGRIAPRETPGLLVLLGVGAADAPEAWEMMVRKIAELRLLPREGDPEGRREYSALEVGAPVLVVSQFTLMGRTKKGRRPSWSDAAPGAEAEEVIEKVVSGLRERGLVVETGSFGAHMKVSSVNDGPFTVVVET